MLNAYAATADLVKNSIAVKNNPLILSDPLFGRNERNCSRHFWLMSSRELFSSPRS